MKNSKRVQTLYRFPQRLTEGQQFSSGIRKANYNCTMRKITLLRQPVLRNQFYILGVWFCFVVIMPISLNNVLIPSGTCVTHWNHQTKTKHVSKHVIEGLVPLPRCLQSSFHFHTTSNNVAQDRAAAGSWFSDTSTGANWSRSGVTDSLQLQRNERLPFLYVTRTKHTCRLINGIHVTTIHAHVCQKAEILHQEEEGWHYH